MLVARTGFEWFGVLADYYWPCWPIGLVEWSAFGEKKNTDKVSLDNADFLTFHAHNADNLRPRTATDLLHLLFSGFCAYAYKQKPLGSPSAKFYKERGLAT